MTAAATPRTLACILLAAGRGTRMKSKLPKVLHPVAGRPMIAHVVAAAQAAGAAPITVVIGPDPDQATVAQAVAPHRTAVQAEQRGTGDAVLAARDALAGFTGDILIGYGDAPLVTEETFATLIERARADDRPVVTVLGTRPALPGAYGRMITGPDGGLDAIVEAKDATPEQLAIPLCNAGLMVVAAEHLWSLLDAVGTDNVQGEVYLTDIVAIARARGLRCAVVERPEQETLGVNSRAELAVAEAALQDRLRVRAMAEGVTLIDPKTVFLSADTRFGRDVVIEPHVVIRPGVSIGDEVTVLAFSHLEGAVVGDGSRVGPFARLRLGTVLGARVHVGNYVEVKAATLADGVKANHLSYLGDAEIGTGSNIGAGSITCNYDGFSKSRTVIGSDAFIGSNTALVAPVTVADGATIGAGSVITRDVEAHALALTRAEQKALPGMAAKIRAAKAKAKARKG